ncbi:hypothetical protein AALP_AA6G059300 [Arabis alpina]|uniref:Potassium channel domain-containing protein n=1 Tax=Arabis alpina TaxID=50452 RepID=A0A087GMD1_ARAAL|nr:hypothetical protein AALP_AA6G059300 [Arabis alpina]
MANDDHGGNDVDPLLQYLISSPPPPNDVTIPMPMTPSDFRNRLIFGPQRDSTSLLIHAISQSPSPSSYATTSFSDSSALDFLLPPPEYSLPAPKPKSTHRGYHRSKEAPAMAAINDLTHPMDRKTEQSHSKSVVTPAVALLIVYLSFGVFIYWLTRDSYAVVHTHPIVDGLYFCVVTMCTIGYGDITPDTLLTKLFSILFVLVGFGFMGMLLSGYVIDLQENHMLEAARNKGRVRIRLKVGLALGLVVLCVGFGVLILHFIEEIGWFDSFYFSVMSVTTVGYGDGAFKTLPGRLLAAIWLLVSTLALVLVFLFLAEARVDQRNSEGAKRVLDETMSVSEFFATDIDHNGCVSKAEFVIYQLKKMEKITDKDIIQINGCDVVSQSNCYSNNGVNDGRHFHALKL